MCVASILKTEISTYMSSVRLTQFLTYSSVPNCRGWGGGGSVAHFVKKKISITFNYYKRVT